MKQHGSFALYTEENVLYLKCSGCWNAETTQAFDEKYRTLVNSIIDQPWAAFCDLTEWELSTPDCVPIMNRHMQWCVDHNQRAGVYLIGDSSLFISQLTQMSMGLTIPNEYKFLRTKSVESADHWFNKLNYKFNKTIPETLVQIID